MKMITRIKLFVVGRIICFVVGHVWNVVQSLAAPTTLLICPRCGKHKKNVPVVNMPLENVETQLIRYTDDPNLFGLEIMNNRVMLLVVKYSRKKLMQQAQMMINCARTKAPRPPVNQPANPNAILQAVPEEQENQAETTGQQSQGGKPT